MLHIFIFLYIISYSSKIIFFNKTILEFIYVLWWWKKIQNRISFKKNSNFNIHFWNLKNISSYHFTRKLIDQIIFNSILWDNIEQRDLIIWIHKRNIYYGKYINFMIMTSEGFKSNICEAIYNSRFSNFQLNDHLQTPRFILWLWVFHIKLNIFLFTTKFVKGTFILFSKQQN